MITRDAQFIKQPINAPSPIEDEKLLSFSGILERLEETNKSAIVPLLKKIEVNTSFLKKHRSKLTESIDSKETKPGIVKATVTSVSTRPGPAHPRDKKGRFVATTDERRDSVTSAAPAAGKVVAAKEGGAEKAGNVALVAKPTPAPMGVADVVKEDVEKNTSGQKPSEGKKEIKQTQAKAPNKTISAKKKQGAPVTDGATAMAEGRAIRDKNGRFSSTKSREALERQRQERGEKTILKSLKEGFETITEERRAAAESGKVGEAAGVAAGGPVFEAAMEIKEAVDGVRSEDSLIGKTARKIGMIAGLGKETPTVEETAKEGRDEKGRFVKESLGKSEKEEQKRHKELIETIKENSGKGGGNGGGLGLGLGFTGKKALGGIARLAKPLSGLARLSGPALALAGAGTVGYGVGAGINALINKLGEKVTGKKDWSLGGQIYDWFHGDAATQFEAGKGKSRTQAAATISSGKGDKGGKSYGSYQLSSKEGEVGKFLQRSGYASQFAGLQVGSRQFDSKWEQLAANDQRFVAAQKQYAVETKYNPQMQKLVRAGVNLSGKGRAVQEMVLSTANQYGAGTSVIQKALKGKNVSAMSESDIINAVQNYKAANVETNFKSSSFEVKAGVAKRIQQERAYLLAVNEQEKKTGGAKAALSSGVPMKAKAEAKPRVKVALAQKMEKKAKAQHPDATTGRSTAKETAHPTVATTLAEPVRDAKTVKKIDGKIDPKPVARPERLKPEAVAFKAKQAPTATQNAGNQDLSKLIASLSQIASSMEAGGKDGERQKETNPGMNIRTEFDDTMLTLMAYDRV